MRRPILIQTMEMQRSALVAQGVLDIDDDLVTLGSDNWLNRPLAIDAHHWACLLSIWIRISPRDVEVVCDSRTMRERCEKMYWKEEAGKRDSHGVEQI